MANRAVNSFFLNDPDFDPKKYQEGFEEGRAGKDRTSSDPSYCEGWHDGCDLGMEPLRTN